MSPATYTFRNEWTLPGRHAELYDVLEDVGSYPTWWPQVRAVAAVGEEVALVACRSFLPYTLHVELRPRVRDRTGGVLEASLAGDLVGHSRWVVEPDREGSRTRLRYHQLLRAAPRGRWWALLGLGFATARRARGLRREVFTWPLFADTPLVPITLSGVFSTVSGTAPDGSDFARRSMASS